MQCVCMRLCVCVTVSGHNNPNQCPVLTVKYNYIMKLEEEVDVNIIFPFYKQSQRDKWISFCVSLKLYVFSNLRFGWLTSG